MAMAMMPPGDHDAGEPAAGSEAVEEEVEGTSQAA